MIKRSKYPAWHRKLNLSKEQKEALGEMLEAMMIRLSKFQDPDGDQADYFAGKEAGLNSAWRMIDGELQNHDEFDD